MLESIRCKRMAAIFIVKLASEGYFAASTFEFRGGRSGVVAEGARSAASGRPLERVVRQPTASAWQIALQGE
jgi:hypothetical protein